MTEENKNQQPQNTVKETVKETIREEKRPVEKSDKSTKVTIEQPKDDQ